MARDSKTPRSACPINHALEILGDRWTLLVVRDMVFQQKRSFSELKAMPEGIASNILSERLTRLQGAQIVVKRSMAVPTCTSRPFRPFRFRPCTWMLRRKVSGGIAS
ncbi:MAG: helix-turn-helix domain-containing protein, partial [Pseudomonadota bacterium]